MRELAFKFPKPAYYAGLEDGLIRKNPENLSLHIALAFPDTYEVGMSYLGQKILYDVVNANPSWWAERVMCPEWEAARIMRQHNTPLASLESDTPLAKLDAICFSVTHELCFTDILHMLDLAGLPLRTSQRSEDLSDMPLILAGGGAILGGAEALAPFIDLAALGDGEELFPEILHLLEKAHQEGWPRSRFLEEAALIPGVYIPSFFTHDAGGKIMALKPGYRPARRIVTDLNNVPYPVRQPMPIGAVHNRLALEIARGCTRGCRFCHAGIVYRPPRERNPETLVKILDQCLDATGYEEVSFLSLSAGDYSALQSLYKQSYARCAQEQISLALPSLRVGSVGKDILARMASLRRTGMTLAPEAGSQRLRDVINKGITEAELLEHVMLLGDLGWQQLKLYFMIGLPSETDEDLQGIFELCRKAQAAGSARGRKMRVTAAISTFVPKPFTPFQWEAQISLEETRRRIAFLRDLFKSARNLQLRWHEPAASHLEGLLSRSDRRIADVVEKAYRKGAVFCSWNEFFKLEPWLEAMEECGLDAESFKAERNVEQPLPWEHLECGISRDYLLKERKRAFRGEITQDCRYGLCGNCGACDKPGRTSRLARSSSEKSSKCLLVFPDRDQTEEGQQLAYPLDPASSSKPSLELQAAQYRLWHGKMGAFSLLSQLELQAYMEKVLRRSKLPLAFSHGFHPLPRISFGRALPVGVESCAEWLAISLTQDLETDFIQKSLNRFLRKELHIFHVEYTDRKLRTEQAQKESFLITLATADDLDKASEAFAGFASKETCEYSRMTRKGQRTNDLRPMLISWERSGNSANSLEILCDWSVGYISPSVLASAILNPNEERPEMEFKICKMAQIFADGRCFSPDA